MRADPAELMRPVLHGDVVAAARALLPLPDCARAAALRGMLARAAAADAYRKRFGRAHRAWGNGSLMAVALPRVRGAEPFLDDAEYCRCLALVFETLAAWRAENRGRAALRVRARR
ncbi:MULTISPECIES: DUF7742 family protein [Actibacterium]|uniref:DUF7742 domain-containing protein n=1 Tax=Actibacterium naphthalenivorans TaxID=1614693 RepID=A0A840C7X5_9RHOB|nr:MULTISPECIES: hypothetical protein [Actibacterium]MBB4022054.1 hypothetical protein [Actibacterium naphthalenivorans]